LTSYFEHRPLLFVQSTPATETEQEKKSAGRKGNQLQLCLDSPDTHMLHSSTEPWLLLVNSRAALASSGLAFLQCPHQGASGEERGEDVNGAAQITSVCLKHIAARHSQKKTRVWSFEAT